MKTTSQKLSLVAALLFVGLFSAHQASALACNDQANGNWNSAGTWSCGAIPGSGDTVTIDSHTVTLTQAQSAASVTMSGGTFNMVSYTLTDGGSWTYTSGTLNAGTGTVLLTGTSTFTPGSASYYNIEYGGNNPTYTLSGTATILNNFTMSTASTLTMNGGTLDVQGNVTETSGSPNGGTTVIQLSGTKNQTMSMVSGYYFNNVTINKSGGTLTLSGTIVINGNWTFIAGALDAGTSTLKLNGCGSTFTPGPASYNNIEDALSGGCGMTVSGTGTVLGNLSFTGGATTLNTGTLNVWGNITYPVSNTQSGTATINISGTGNQTLSSAGGGYYPNITVNKPSGTLTLSGTIFVRNWTYTAGNIDAGTSTLKVNGCGTTFTPGNIVYYNVDGASTGGCSVTLASNLKLSNSFSQAGGAGIFSTNGYSIITKNFSSGSGTVNLGASVVKISGNITNAGVLNANTSTVILNGTNQSITGATTFYNLYKILPAGTADTLTFGASTTYTIASGGTARFIGSRDGLLSLRSSSSGTAYTLTKTGSINAEYVDMKDCTVSGATTARASVNTSGNTSWTFTKEFISKIRSAGGDYTTLSGWESAVQNNLTTSKVFSHGGITGTIPDNTAVTGATSGATGTAVHATSTQILIKTITGTFQSGEQIRVDVSNYVTTSDAGFTPIAVAEVYNDWSASGLNDSVTLAGWTTGADNYILIVAPNGQRHQGLLKDPATSWYRGFTLKPTSSGVIGIDASQDYTRVEGIAVDLAGASGTTTSYKSSNTGTRWDKDIAASGTTGFNLSGGAFVANSMAYDATGNCFQDVDATTTHYTVYNSTARGCAKGFQGDNTTTAVTLKNVLASANVTADFSLTNTGAKSVTYSASSDATSDDYGTPTGDRVSQTFSFMNVAGKDFRLADNDTGAKGYALDLSSDATYPIIDDISYAMRPEANPSDASEITWDIGGDEAHYNVNRLKKGIRVK